MIFFQVSCGYSTITYDLAYVIPKAKTTGTKNHLDSLLKKNVIFIFIFNLVIF